MVNTSKFKIDWTQNTLDTFISIECNYSVTWWIDYLFNFWPFTAMKICPIAFKINQSNLIILPYTKWTLSKWPIFLTSCQSGEIPANLVTLLAREISKHNDDDDYENFFWVKNPFRRRRRRIIDHWVGPFLPMQQLTLMDQSWVSFKNLREKKSRSHLTSKYLERKRLWFYFRPKKCSKNCLMNILVRIDLCGHSC